ncbi:AraC family transcriptional regulator, partial [bacterium]
MPVYTTRAANFIDPDSVPRPVISIGLSPRKDENADVVFHRHRKAELLFVASGSLVCEVAAGLWLVPPQSALWIPAGAEHRVEGIGRIEIFCLFIEPELATAMETHCCSIAVTPLLRELIKSCAQLPELHPLGGAESRLSDVLLDQISNSPVENWHLPLPADSRLRQIADSIMKSPADRTNMRE